jgi:hypothetical protein
MLHHRNILKSTSNPIQHMHRGARCVDLARIWKCVIIVEGCYDDVPFFAKKPRNFIYSSINTQKVIKITNRSLDHLATTTWAKVMLSPSPLHHWQSSPSPESDKALSYRTCCSWKIKIRCSKASKDQHTRAATIVNDETYWSEETGLKPYEWTRKPIRSARGATPRALRWR